MASSQQQATALAAAARKAYASGGDIKKVLAEAKPDPGSIAFDGEPITFQRGELPGKKWGEGILPQGGRVD